MKTKFFTIFLVLAAGTGTLFAESGKCGDNLTWDLTDGVLTISGSGDMTNWSSSAAVPWYSYRENITRVIIGNSVTSIGNYAFYGYSSLTSVTMGNSVTSIGSGAFAYCSGLTSIEIPNSVTSIGRGAFENCTGLTSITIPNSVTSIGNSAFAFCSGMTSVTIPNSVTSIGNYAFQRCSGLTSVTIPNSVTSIGSKAFDECSGLTSVTIPNSVTSIGYAAFSGCSGLTSIEIPNSVTSIGGSAFNGCTSLTSVTIPNSVTSIGNYAFNNVPNVSYSGTATDSPWGARSVNGYVDEFLVYSDNTKTNLLVCSAAATGAIEIPNSVTSMQNNTFYGCSGLTSVTTGNSVTSIGSGAFYGCSGLTSVTIGNSVTSIGSKAFSGCTNITAVTWNAKNCANNGGFGSQVESFTFGNEVEFIPEYCCSEMNQLTNITIPNNVTSIGSKAFSGCTNITAVTWNAKNCANNGGFGSQVESFTFGNEVEFIPEYCCSEMNQLTNITIPNNVTSIGAYAFYRCTGLTSITIPNNVTSIGAYAFKDCYRLTSITISNSVTSIGGSAFNGCTSLTSITIPNSVTSIGNSAFRNCSGLTSVTIGNSVTSIGEYAFLSCSGLTSITIPNSVTCIGYYAFRNCTSLTHPVYNAHIFAYLPTSYSGVYSIPDGIESIASGAFYGCSGLTCITIPNSVTSIGDEAFPSCSGLTSVTIGNSVTSIGDYAFYSCTGLTSVYNKASTPQSINSNVFHGVNISSCILHVPCGSIAAYQTANVWKDFDTIVGMECPIFTITWLQDDGTLIDQTIVEYGQTPTPTDPTKAATAEYTYTFKGWTPDIAAVTGDATYTAQFDSVKNVYRVTWLNSDNTELGKDSLAYGIMPEYKGKTPRKDSTDVYAYTFKDWEPAITAVTGDATYKAEFDSAKIVYPVNIEPADPAIEVHGEVQIDGTSTFGETITITPIPDDGYYFDGWSDGNTDNPRQIEVTGDVNIYPIFKKCEEIVVNISQVIFKGSSYEFGGELLSTRGTYVDTITLASGCDSVVVLKLSVIKMPTYNLRVVVNDETMGTVTGSGTYQQGEQVTITATPVSSKYIFVRWYNEDEDIDIHDNPYTFPLNRNLQIRAVFRKAPRR